MKNTTLCKFVINPGINENDRLLLADLLERVCEPDTIGRDGAEIHAEVELGVWSALCVLEDFDLLTCEQE